MTSSLHAAMALMFLASCASTAPTGRVADDVYERPDRRFVATAGTNTTPASGQRSGNADEYYDPAAAEAQRSGSYYDMAYNDPYYYNRGRFSFGASVGSWGPYGGMGMGYGWGAPFYSSFGGGFGGYRPWGMYNGFGGFGNPYYGGFGSPFYGGYYDPFWGMNGFGPYYGPWGNNCFGCYYPLMSPVVYQRRSDFGSAGAGSLGGGSPAPRSYTRDPIGLMPATREPSRIPRDGSITTPRDVERGGTRPSRTIRPSNDVRTPSRQGREIGTSPSRSFGGGGGGGGRTPAVVRPR